MGVTVIFTGPDGQSHFRDETMGRATDKRAVVYPRHTAGGWEITETPAGFRSALGITKKTRTLVVLAGELQMGVGSGETRTFRPGDVIHATDTTGQGHTSAVPGPEPARVLNVLSEPD